MSSFFTLAFASFVEAQHDFNMSFSDWLKVQIFSWSALRVTYRRWVAGKDGNLQVGHGDSVRFCSSHSHENLAKSCFYAGHMEHA